MGWGEAHEPSDMDAATARALYEGTHETVTPLSYAVKLLKRVERSESISPQFRQEIRDFLLSVEHEDFDLVEDAEVIEDA